MKAVHEGFHHFELAMSRGHAGQLLGLGDRERNRLLAKHVLPGLERTDRPLHVEMVRQRIVDRVDVRVGEQILIRAVGLLDAQFCGDRLRPRHVARSNGRDGAKLALLSGRNDVYAADFGRTQNSPANLGHVDCTRRKHRKRIRTIAGLILPIYAGPQITSRQSRRPTTAASSPAIWAPPSPFIIEKWSPATVCTSISPPTNAPQP